MEWLLDLKAVTPKCLGGPPVDRDRLNAPPGDEHLMYYICNTTLSILFGMIWKFEEGNARSNVILVT
ncbi:hypothetical protein TNCV_3360861 [Trichonephila clavipes]|nr:hypothetical protein TNCV_3360861 [Trichonephila clavipes]